MNKIIAIAIDEYDDISIQNLKNCTKDVNSLIDVLSKKYQFDSLELYLKPEQTSLSFLYNELYNELINSLESDNILIIYAGHGEYNPTLGTSYWLCSDSNKANVTTWFNVNDLLQFFNASLAKHIALISDSCFSGAIFELSRGGGAVALESKASRQALTSGGIETVSDGRQDTNSPFNNALLRILDENSSDILSFNQLSEKTILEFSKDRSQTPAFGSLINSGDKGGTFFFQLKPEDDSSIVKSIQIPLEINKNVKIDSSFEIPFFNENKIFKSDFVNAFVQQLGYSIINDVRVFVTEDEDYSVERSSEMEFYLEVNYKVETLNQKFLSVLINRSDCFGSMYINNYVYSINFKFNPERKISLYDILDYSGFQNLEEFLIKMIEKYSEEECKEILTEYSTYEYCHQLDFTFNDKAFTIYYMNLFPHAFKCCGFLEIPIDQVKFKL